MSSYSFLDVSASIDGPGGNFSLKGENAEEGISIDPVGDQSTMTVGADGKVMHSLAADSAVTVTVRLLKTSGINAQLREMFKYQTASAARHGQNTITVRDAVRGDLEVISDAAFKKLAPNSWAKQGNVLEWAFDGVISSGTTGSGTAEATEE
jgi:hypothetical protein